MEQIQRPKQVQRSQKNYLTNEKYQDYSESQFKNIYDYLDSFLKSIQEEETVLFDNPSNSSTTITLSESVADFEYIEVFYRVVRQNKTIVSSQKLYAANGKYIDMHILFRDGTMNYGSTSIYSISNKTISLVTGSQYEFSNGSGMGANQNNSFYITKVIGIKRKE